MAWLEGKAVVVTGAGRGIGRAYARAIAREGAGVVVNDIDAEVAEAVAAEIREAGGTGLAHVADIRDWGAAADLIDRCVGEYGAIHGLVNNAGVFGLALPGEITAEQLADLLAVHVNGVVACSVPAIRQMRSQGGGSIVNVTSGAHFGIPHMAGYAAAKGAVASLTYAWALELTASGIRVNAISPLARTRMLDTLDAFQRENGLPHIDTTTSPEPESNAPVAVYLLSDAAAYLTGQVVRIEGNELALVAHPAVLEPVLTAADSWNVEGVADAFAQTFSQRLVPVGMAPLLRAEYLSGSSAFWDGSTS